MMSLAFTACIAKAPVALSVAARPARLAVAPISAARPVATASVATRREALTAGFLAAVALALPQSALADASGANFRDAFGGSAKSSAGVSKYYAKITAQGKALTGFVTKDLDCNPSVYVQMVRELEGALRFAGDGDKEAGLYEDMRRAIILASSFNKTRDEETGKQVIAAVDSILASLQ